MATQKKPALQLIEANARIAALKAQEAWSIIRSRVAQRLGYSHDGNRDLYAAFGYKRDIRPIDLYSLYTRQDIAHRIIKAFPQATWRDTPVVRDEAGNGTDPNQPGYSEFADKADTFFDMMRVMHYMERADRLASIGRFGLLYMGFADGKPEQPLADGKNELVFLSAYSEMGVQITSWTNDMRNPRFGMPEMYSLNAVPFDSDSKAPQKTFKVHASRIIHIAEILDQDETYGIPRLLPVVNRLQDLEKVVGGSAETFWLTANRGIALWADKEAQLDEEQQNDIKEQLKSFAHGMQRTLSGQGMNAQILGSESPDPAPNADKLLSLIAGAVGIPMRILLGTERGQLASGQDENNWSQRVGERRRMFATPMMLRPFIDLMIKTGNLPAPEGHWWPEWSDTDALPADSRSQIAERKTNALANYARTPGADLVVPIPEFRTKILELPPEPPEGWAVDTTELGAPVQPTNPNAPGGDPNNPIDVTNAHVAPLYVSRNVLNTKAIKDWAKAQDITVTEDPLHVTICYSKMAVDWMKFQQSFGEDEDGKMMVHPGGPRAMELFGPNSEGKYALVLQFNNTELQWRQKEFCDGGASYDHADYQPHITLAYVDQGFEIGDIEPYTGAIALGPEIFQDVKE